MKLDSEKTSQHKISALQYITHELEHFSHADQAEIVCASGCKWVQARVKNKNGNELKEILQNVKKVCNKYNTAFIVNDHVELANELKANGVHLGKKDMKPLEARKILGDDFIIGGTANTLSDIEYLIQQEVSYIGLGPFRFTTTKEKLSPVLGLPGYKTIIDSLKKMQINIPIIAIGGIKTEDITDILSTGIHGVAISSEINRNSQMTEKTKEILTTITNHNKNGKA